MKFLEYCIISVFRSLRPKLSLFNQGKQPWSKINKINFFCVCTATHPSIVNFKFSLIDSNLTRFLVNRPIGSIVENLKNVLSGRDRVELIEKKLSATVSTRLHPSRRRRLCKGG